MSPTSMIDMLFLFWQWIPLMRRRPRKTTRTDRCSRPSRRSLWQLSRQVHWLGHCLLWRKLQAFRQLLQRRTTPSWRRSTRSWWLKWPSWNLIVRGLQPEHPWWHRCLSSEFSLPRAKSIPGKEMEPRPPNSKGNVTHRGCVGTSTQATSRCRSPTAECHCHSCNCKGVATPAQGPRAESCCCSPTRKGVATPPQVRRAESCCCSCTRKGVATPAQGPRAESCCFRCV